MCGVFEVHAGGSRVSRAEEEPCTRLYPVTEAVIIPSVADARARVDRCPNDITDATMNECSRSCVLSRREV